MGVTGPSAYSGTDYVPNMDNLDPYGNHLQQQPDRKRKVTSQFGQASGGQEGQENPEGVDVELPGDDNEDPIQADIDAQEREK